MLYYSMHQLRQTITRAGVLLTVSLEGIQTLHHPKLHKCLKEHGLYTYRNPEIENIHFLPHLPPFP